MKKMFGVVNTRGELIATAKTKKDAERIAAKAARERAAKRASVKPPKLKLKKFKWSIDDVSSVTLPPRRDPQTHPWGFLLQDPPGGVRALYWFATAEELLAFALLLAPLIYLREWEADELQEAIWELDRLVEGGVERSTVAAFEGRCIGGDGSLEWAGHLDDLLQGGSEGAKDLRAEFWEYAEEFGEDDDAEASQEGVSDDSGEFDDDYFAEDGSDLIDDDSDVPGPPVAGIGDDQVSEFMDFLDELDT